MPVDTRGPQEGQLFGLRQFRPLEMYQVLELLGMGQPG